MLFTLRVNSEYMDHKFREAVKLLDDGKYQECIDIWMELSKYGHLDSIEQTIYILLDKRDFEAAERHLKLASNAKAPIILYLRARLIEERDGASAAINEFRAAAEAGNPNAISLLFDAALKARDFEEAKFQLDRLSNHKQFLALMNEPTTFDNLCKELERHQKFFQNLKGFKAEEKVFTIAVGSDESDTYLEIRVYDYWDKHLVANFEDDLIGAVEFCHSKDQGFEVIYVGDSWDFSNTDIVYHCKVNWSSGTITISENYEDYWFGELKDIDSAIEELIDKECDWEIVNYHLISDRIEADTDDEGDEMQLHHFDLSPDDFNLVGSFKIESDRVYIGDPSEIIDYSNKTPEENDVWTALEGLNIFDFGNLSLSEERVGLVYAEENDERRVLKVLLSFDGMFEDDISTREFVVGNWLRVSSGQLMVGDPYFLASWNSCDGEVWNLDGKEGEFSYQGASATTITNGYGVLADEKAVVFNTGYGDGNYYVFFQIVNENGEALGQEEFDEALSSGFAKGLPRDYKISKVILDFITEVE